jgi:hypothetical protein
VFFCSLAEGGCPCRFDIDLCQIAKIGDFLQSLLRCVDNHTDTFICMVLKLV